MRNRVDIIGRLGKDPELRHLDNGKIVCNFSMATTERWKNDRGEKVEHSEWHNIVIWGKQAEVVHKYVKKGDLFGIVGKLRTRSWEKDGITRYTTEILVDEIMLLPNGERRPQGSFGSEPRNSVTSPSSSVPASDKVDTDDLPF